MEKGRKVSYIEGLAIHGGPESCVGVCEGVGEALTGGVQAGLLSREMTGSRVPTLFKGAEGDTATGATREPVADPARSKNPCMHASLHAREPGDPMAARPRSGTGREGKAKAASPR